MVDITGFALLLAVLGKLYAATAATAATAAGPATIPIADEPGGAGFVCRDNETQALFCPPDFELQLFPAGTGESSGPIFIAECAALSS